MGYPYQFQIGPTSTNITYLPRWGIAWPVTWPYLPWAVTETRSDGYHVGFGYPRVTWSWDNMGQGMLHRFLNWFTLDADATVEMYIQTYKDTGPMLDYATFLCLMHRPVDGQGKTLHARVLADRAAFSNVSIEFTRLEEQ